MGSHEQPFTGVSIYRRSALQLENPPSEPLSIVEIREKLAGEWVLVRITGYDEHHIPAQGQLIAHSPSNRSVCKMLDMALISSQPSDDQFYFFSAFKPLPPGTDIRSALTEPTEEGDDNDWNLPRRR